jgi:hypothetical protein
VQLVSWANAAQPCIERKIRTAVFTGEMLSIKHKNLETPKLQRLLEITLESFTQREVGNIKIKT